MLSLRLILLSISLRSLLVRASPPYEPSFDPHAYHLPRFDRRNYIAPADRLKEYDFIVAGGGAAGLILASRLSDDESKTVLVLEAGPSGDDQGAKINPPAVTYFDSLLGKEPFDWLYTSTPQAAANDRTIKQPRGKLLGGSAAINGMYMVRPSKNEVDAWRDLIAPNDAKLAEAWGWDSMFAAFKDIEKFSPPTQDAQTASGVKYTESSFGNSGNLHVTYPAYMVPLTSRWLPTLEAAGVPAISDAYSGHNVGGFFATSAINPGNWTRSFSKNAWIDPLAPRANLHVISGATVERVTFSDKVVDSNRVASGIVFSTGKGTSQQTVSVTDAGEVLVCGGAMGSPHILQVSGVGPKDVLEGAGVKVEVELPGVGQHYTDHLAAGVAWKTDEDTQGTIRTSGSDFSKTPEFLSFVNSGIAYVNGSLLFGGDESFATFRAEITNALDSSASTLVQSQYKEVVEGYKTMYATTSKLHDSAGLIELLLSLNTAGQVTVQAATQMSMSQGRLFITTPSIYDNPTIDPAYYSHPADIIIHRQGIKMARLVGSSAPLKDILLEEVSPGPDVQTDEQIETWLRGAASTEYHPGNTCAMLPKDKGGVVDAQLKVYGTTNLRVVDSSVFPVSFSAHLMAPTYALAHKAADVIKESRQTTTAPPPGTGSGSTPNPTQGPTGAAFGLRPTWTLLAASIGAVFLL